MVSFSTLIFISVILPVASSVLYSKVVVYGVDGLESLVEHAYFSHEIGLKKPNRDIFDHVVANSHIKPEESIFIDDNEANIKAAKALGFNTIFLKNNDMENLKF